MTLPLMRHSLLAAVAALAMLVGSPLLEAAPAPCGTVVLPTGLGVEPTAQPVFSLHPILTNNSIYDTEVFQQLYRPLLWMAPDLTIDYANSEASSIDVSADDTVFTVHLKPWRWSDGQPVVADDIVYCLEMIRALGASYYGWGADGMPDLFVNTRALDPLTLEIRTPHPVNPEWFEELGIQTLYALPRHVWGKLDPEAQRARSGDPTFFSVVDGPFEVAEYSVGRYIALKPNPQWIGHQPQMQRLVMDFLAGIDPLEALQAGEIDVATIPFSVYAKVAKLPGYRIVKLPPLPTYDGMYYNLRNPKVAFLRDVRVRQAIADAIDQKAIIDVIYKGNGVPIYGPVPPANETFLSPAAKAGHYPIGYDPVHARALLKQAGYTPGPDGIMQKDGVRLELVDLVSSNSGDRLLLGEYVQADLAKIGIRLDLRQMDFNQMLALAYRSTDGWEMTSIGSTFPSYPDLGAVFASTAQQNFSHLEDPLTDKLLDDLTRLPGRDALYAAQDRISETQPQLFLPSGNAPLLARDGVEGYEEAIQSNFMWKPEYLRLTGSRACPAATASRETHAPG